MGRNRRSSGAVRIVWRASAAILLSASFIAAARAAQMDHDAIGPTSRKTGIVFSEIMYKPGPRADTNNVEYIEIYNTNPWFHDIGNYRIAGDGMTFTFPTGTVIQAQQYLVVAASAAGMQAAYGLTNVWQYTGALAVNDTLKLFDEAGALLLTVEYDNELPWPVAADGTGHALALANPTYGEGDPRAWDISSRKGGTPGAAETFPADPLDGVIINEFLAHTDPPLHDYIELYNHANTAKTIGGAWLSNAADTNKFRIPPGTTIPARGFVMYDDTQLGFRLDTMGDQIYLVNSNNTRVIDAINFDGQENPVSSGRVPDGGPAIHRLAARTPATNNGAIRAEAVVINEIMYNPITRNDADEYVELYNRTASPVNIGGWAFTKGISFTFPSNTTIPGYGYLVVAKDAAHLRTNHAQLNFANCIGDYGGTLANGGERLVLALPDSTINSNAGQVVTNYFSIPVTEVTYGTGGRWGMWSDGDGSSIELIDPDANPRLAPNWADSDDTAKSQWTTIETTGVLDNGSNYESSILHGQLGMLDVGECLVDDVEVYEGTNTLNLVTNATFEGGLPGWSIQGCYMRSTLENTGFGGSGKSLHVRASSRMWTGANSCEFTLVSNVLASGRTGTLRFRAKWLHGWPEAIMRLNGNWLEATGPLIVPANLGTPGQQNSRYATNAGPAITEVAHTPSVPGTNQAAVVTARIHDPDGIQSFTLRYRLDPATNLTAVTMRDDGTGGDAIAGDGLYSATIPGQAARKVVAFHLTAADTPGAATRFPALRDINEPARECVVLFGDSNPASNFGTYHLWITQAMIDRWATVSDLSNESHDCTMVNGNRVIYNMVGRFAGSPYHQSFNTPTGALCHFKWTFQKDDAFLGATSFNKIHQPGNSAGSDNMLQREDFAYRFMRHLGVPWNYRRFMAVYINGNRRGKLMEDTQTPDSDVCESRWPDDQDGWLYKMQPWFEFAPSPTNNSSQFANRSWCNLVPYISTNGAKKMARYRWNWMVRKTPVSANDYTNVYLLVDAAASSGANYVANMKNMADMENWMRVFAVNHACANWDSFGAQNAQNLYGYIGAKGTKYSLLMWDLNIVFNTSGWAPGANLFTVNGQDPNMSRIYNTPEFRRMYWRALRELCYGPLDPTNSGPLLDAKYNAFVADGQSVENPDTYVKPWIISARDSILSQLASENTTNFLVSPSVSIVNNTAYLSGTAPVDAKTVLINGTEWPVTWNSVTSWSAAVPLAPGTNLLDVVGVDMDGLPIAGYTGATTAVYSGPIVAATGNVVISEIMYAPGQPGEEYVEVQNLSSSAGFDLSGWRANGLSYTFPSGSHIGPSARLVLASDRRAFTSAYGATNPPFDAFSGGLDGSGETLSLFMNDPATTLVDRVRYETVAPWPVITNGAALQLVDVTNDNSRVSNWDASRVAPFQWTYYQSPTQSYAINATKLLIYMTGPGEVYIDDFKMTLSANIADPTVITNGDFETDLSGPWLLTSNFMSTVTSTNQAHSGSRSLRLIATAAGARNTNNAISQPVTISGFKFISASFWYLPTTSGATIRVSTDGPTTSEFSINPAPPVQPAVKTPGTANSMSHPLPAYPPLWLNEVCPSNTGVNADNAGEREPWIEIVNTSTAVVSLAGYHLSDNYTNLTQWAFPANATVPAGGAKIIWCDGQTNQTAGDAHIHAGFRLPPVAGRIALSRIVTNAPQIVDYLTYTNVPVNWSYGDIPDAQPFYRTLMFQATPGATNSGAAPAATISINEWMADNMAAFPDPADGNYEDWIELYNYGDAAVDLGGFYLTDNLGDADKWKFPSNTVVQPGGFLIVWADDETAQNAITNGDRHASFKLGKEGEAIGLFSPSLVAVDTLTFGPQVTDRTDGRWPDAAAGIYRLAIPTPRSNNIANAFNAAPVFTNTPPHHTDELAALQLDNSAIDTNEPPETLRYGLVGAPAGMTIDTNTGVISWLPSESEGPGTNAFGVTVIDNGWPPRGATQQVTLVVHEVNSAPLPGPTFGIDTYAGSLSTVIFAPATDQDIPANALSYALAPGAPEGIGFDPVARTVTWTPPDEHAGQLVTVGIVATDNGVPPLSATGFVAFNVAPAGSAFVAGLASPTQIHWMAVSGGVYRIEYADEMAPAYWNHLTNATAPTNDLLILDLPAATNGWRFYRMWLNP